MPYHNAAKYIEDTVSAIIAQTYKGWELIIVDDCSPASETEKVLKRVAEMDTRIRIMKTPQNVGAGIARNVGIEAAKGKYLHPVIVMIGGIQLNWRNNSILWKKIIILSHVRGMKMLMSR